MKARHDWHRTRLGGVVLFLGSIQFAVPVLLLTAAALGYGTWVESAHGPSRAGELVYGSWWFISLMALICTILTLAVVTRYPWKRKHTGFMIVHVSLITIIVSGFVTFFTKVEGEIALQEGMSTDSLRTGQSELQLLRHEAGEFELVDASFVDGPGLVEMDGIEFEIIEQWENSIQETVVLDDGSNELHAVELSFDHLGEEAYWVGQLREGEQPPNLGGVAIRVLPQGQSWSPPNPDESAHAAFHHAQGTGHIDLGELGDVVSEGWSIESIRRFKHALVGPDGIGEGDSNRDNPAVEVILAHEDGSRERHIAFVRFRGNVNKKTIEGESFSELVLSYEGEELDMPTLVITRNGEASSALFVTPMGERAEWELAGDGPWTLDLGQATCIVHHAFGNARGTTQLVEAAMGEENTPALRVRVLNQAEGDDQMSPEPMTIAWGQRVMVPTDDRVVGLSYAPSTRPIPFSIELVEFRKRDYPGSEQAMAFESDVRFAIGDGEPQEQTIWMNNPLEYDGWKVYQAGFVGSNVSIFQVTKDPGLIPMYIGCTALCLGILIMYYCKAYSHGHPGMPEVFRAESRSVSDASEVCVDGGASAGSDDARRGAEQSPSQLEDELCQDSDPGSRSDDAAGLVRTTRRSRSHRAHKVG